MLGAFTGNIIAAVAAAFVVFYAWFFWLRGLLGRSGPTDSDGAIAELRHEVEPPGAPAPAPMTKAAATKPGAAPCRSANDSAVARFQRRSGMATRTEHVLSHGRVGDCSGGAC